MRQLGDGVIPCLAGTHFSPLFNSDNTGGNRLSNRFSAIGRPQFFEDIFDMALYRIIRDH